MTSLITDPVRKTGLVLAGAAASFRRNNDLGSSSSMAFSAMLALIPALFLLTSVVGMVIGSSQEAIRKVQDLVQQVIPSYSQEILKEVRYIVTHKRTFGMLNFLVFVLAVTPLVSDLRTTLGRIFRVRPTRHFLLEKLVDVSITVVFLLGIAAVTLAGVALSVAERFMSLPDLPDALAVLVQFLFSAGAVTLVYAVFSRSVRIHHLAAGAVVGTALWFLLRPLFHLFLAYNPGYGLAFGSFKSLFVAIIWIYYSLAVFLAGAEIAAAIGRRETVFLRHLLMDRSGGPVPASFIGRYVHRYGPGENIFLENDDSTEMFSVRTGSVAIVKDGREIGVIGPGQCFGQMSFLLGSRRIATAVAREDTEVVAVRNENIRTILNEFPDLAVEMLKDMAVRLREMSRPVD